MAILEFSKTSKVDIDKFLRGCLERLEKTSGPSRQVAEDQFKILRDNLVPFLDDKNRDEWEAYDLKYTPDANSERIKAVRSTDKLDKAKSVDLDNLPREVVKGIVDTANDSLKEADRKVVELAREAGIDGNKYLERLKEPRDRRAHQIWMDREAKDLARNKDITENAAQKILRNLNRDTTQIYQETAKGVDRMTRDIGQTAIHALNRMASQKTHNRKEREAVSL